MFFQQVGKQSQSTRVEGGLCTPLRGGVIKRSKIYVDGLSAPKSNKEREAAPAAGARSLGTRNLSPGSAWPTKGWRGICLKKNRAECKLPQSIT